MQCNIDARGKLARLIWGILLLIAAVICATLWALPRGGFWPWFVTIVLAAAGAFAIFESRKGWCVMRAMGFKTPM